MAESLQPETEQSRLARPADHIYVADSRFGRGVFARMAMAIMASA